MGEQRLGVSNGRAFESSPERRRLFWPRAECQNAPSFPIESIGAAEGLDRSLPPETRALRIIILALVLLLGVAALPGLGSRDFWPPDEARYGRIAYEMKGDFRSPGLELNGEAYLDKPPLYFWAVRASAWLTTGAVDEFSTRLPSVLGALLCVVVVAVAAGGAAGPHSGFLSGLFLVTTAHFLWQARYAQLDMLYAGLATTGLFLGYSAIEMSAPRRLVFAFLALALAVLTKEPRALLVLPFIGAWALFSRPTIAAGVRYRGAFGLGLLLLLAVLGGFGYWIHATEGAAYLRRMVVDRMLARAGQALAHEQKPTFYALRYLSGGAPWYLLGLLYLFPSVREGAGRDGRRLWWFSLLWSVAYLGLLSAAPGKRSIYMLPVYPTLAIVAGLPAAIAVKVRTGAMARSLLYLTALLVFAAVALAGGALLWAGSCEPGLASFLAKVPALSGRIPRLTFDLAAWWSAMDLPRPGDPGIAGFQRALRLAGLPFGLASLTALYWILRSRPATAIEFLAIGVAVGFAATAALVLPRLDGEMGRRVVAEGILAKTSGGPTAIFDHLDEGILFYHRAPLTVIEPSASELAAIEPRLKKSERDAAIFEIERAKLAAFFAAGGERSCIMRSTDLSKLAAAGMRLDEVYAADLHGKKTFVLVKLAKSAEGSGQ